jgi:hypothetical protein
MDMKYLRIVDGAIKYPYTYQDLIKDFPGIGWPQNPFDMDLTEYGIHFVVDATIPEYNLITHCAVMVDPKMINGNWVEQWEILPLDEAGVKSRIEDYKRMVVARVQQRLDTFARTKQYDGIMSAVSYLNSTDAQFKLEAEYCLSIRDATWRRLYDLMAEVESGQRPMPQRYEDIAGDLPVLEWPQ